MEDDDAGEISEPEDPVMLQRDAKDWKGQDHYAVLGLSKYRYRATPEQIKRAHRKKVLRHHPDKKAAAGRTEEDSFFKCIQKATEVLSDPVKRRQFDSVDEAADVEPPTKKQTQKGNFYKLWDKVFVAEGRFSKTQPVPRLGNENSSKEEVEHFYNFWYNFDSWRTFEYQDEDVPDDNENRDQKRHVERKNNAARKKKKTEDTARLRRLVDDALALDERIKLFRQQDRAQRNRKKNEREAEAKAAAEQKEKDRVEAERVKAEEDLKAKTEREQRKKANDAVKNAMKKNKRVVKGAVKDANYFHTGGDAPAATITGVLDDVDALIAKLDAVELADFATRLGGKKGAEVKPAFEEETKRVVGAGKAKEGELKTLET